MSLGDAYADAHLTLESLAADLNEASGMLERAVARWESILSVSGTVDLDAAGATALVEQAAAEWRAIIDEGLTGTVEIDTAAATGEVAAATQTWQSLVESVTGEVGVSTDEATNEIGLAVAVWREALSANLTATVDMDTDRANDTLAASLIAWREAVESDLAVAVDMDTADATAQLSADASLWSALVDGSLVATVDMDTGGATERLAAAAAVWRSIVGADLTAVVDIDTDRANDTLARSVLAWRAAVASSLMADVDIDTEATTGKLLLALNSWESLVTDGVTATVDMDTTGASDRLSVALDEWNVQVGEGVAVAVALDTTTPTEELAIAVEDWQAIVEDAIDASIDMNTGAATEELTVAVEEWRALVDPIPANVDMDTGEATAVLTASAAEWRAIVADAVSARAEMDTAVATDHLAATVEEWRAIVADDLTMNVGLDSDAADDDLIETIAEWRARTADGISIRLDLDTGVSGEQLQTQLAEWQRLARIDVEVNVEDADSLANLATTFAGIRPLTDLPVRFHMDQESIVAATAQVEGLAALWSEILDIGVNPSNTPQGDNDLPNRPGQPARPRGPPSIPNAPTIRPELDGSQAEIQAKLLEQTLESLLTVTAALDLDGSAAIPEAEAIRETVARLTAANVEVDLDDAGIAERAELLGELIQRILAQVTVTPDLDPASVVPQAEALQEALRRILTLSIPTDLDDSAALAAAQRAVAEIETILGRVKVPIEPEVDPAKTVAELDALNGLLKSLLKVVVPVDLGRSGAIAQAEALGPAISELLKVVADVGIDGDGAVASAEALDRVLEQAVSITAPVKVGDKDAIAQLVALDKVFQGLLRDVLVKVTLNGGEATAEMALLRAALEKGTVSIKAELDKARVLADGVLLRRQLAAIAGKLDIDVDIDSAAVRGKLLASNLASDIKSGFRSIFADIGSSLTGMLASLLGSSGGSNNGLARFLTNAAQAGGVLSGVLGELGGITSTLGKGLSAVGGVGVSALTALGSFAVSAVGAVLKLVSVVTTLSIVLTAATAAASALAAGIGAILAAGAGLIGLAGGFATIAGSIGAAGLAAGALGIALNKDLAQQAKDGMTTLKSVVADATREAGAYILDNFLAPYTVAIGSIAKSASQLTPLLVGPVAEAGLRFADAINGVLSSDVGAGIADKLGKGAAGFIDQFAAAIPAYSTLINDVLGQTTGLRDIVQTVLDLGLQAGPLFLSLGRLLSAIATSTREFGTEGLGIITRLSDKLADLLTSDTFAEFARLGAFVLNSLLDVIGQLSDGIASVGISDVFEEIAGVVQQIVSSGVFQRLGEIVGQLLDMGASVLGPILDTAVVAFDALMSAVEPLIPIIENFVSVLADQLGAVVQSWVEDGVFTELAEAVGELLNVLTLILTLILPLAAELLIAFGPPLAASLSFLADLFGNYLPRALGWFAAKVGEAIGWVLDKVADLVDFVAGSIDILAQLVEAADWVNRLTGGAGVPDEVITGLRVASTMAEGFSDTLRITGSMMEYTGLESQQLARDYAEAGSAAERSGMAVDLSNSMLERGAAVAEKYGDILGDGAVAIALYGEAHDLTAEQMDAAAQAAVAAAEQFQYTTGLVDQLRTELSKPISLSFDFDKTKLDLDGLVKYVDTQVKTVRDTASQPINTDPTTEAMASAVIGADGTTLNEATTGSKQEIIPEHLDTSIADAVQEMYDNAVRDIDNAAFLKELRFNGFAALADQLEQFDGPKLELAIQELGDSTSQAVRDANKKIEDAQREIDQNANPFQSAIDDAKKQGVLKVRQVQIVQELEAQGLDGLASQVAAIKPEDLEAAIRTYENLTPEVVAGMEKQLDDLAAALEQSVTEIDPIGKMWAAAAATPGAQAGLTGKILTPEEIQAAIGAPSDLNGQQASFAGLLTIIETAVATPKGLGFGGMKPEDVDRWRNLINGFDPNTGKPVENVTDEEAKILAALELRKARSEGKTVGADGTISAGQAEATTAGKAVADAFAGAMTGTEGSKIVTDAADKMISTATGAVAAAVEGVSGRIVTGGRLFVQLLVTGMNIGSAFYLVPAASNLVNTTIRIIDDALSDPENVIGSGRVLANSIAVGIQIGSLLELWPAAGRAGATAVEFAVNAIRESAETLIDAGRVMPTLVAAGIVLGAPGVVTSLKLMGDLAIATIEEQAKRAAFAANLMGQAIGNALGEGLKSSIANIGLAAGDSAAVEKEGGGLIGGGRRRGRGAAQEASDSAASTITGPGVNIGSSIVDGMIAGMQARLPDLIKATQDIATLMAGTMRETLGVRSPSRVTMTIGEQVAEGLARGIDQGNDRVLLSARGLGDRVAGAVTDGVSSLDASGLMSQIAGSMSVAVPQEAIGLASRPPDALTADRALPEPPPSVTLPEQSRLMESLLAAAQAASQPQQNPSATPAANGTLTPAQALLAGQGGGDQPLILVNGDLVISGVPGADELPQRVEGEMWRVGYGQNPRRNIS